MSASDEIVARARACVGARFRPQGRVPAWGLDCVGLVAHAYALDAAPSGYPLRGGTAEGIRAALAHAGFVEAESARPGDLLLLGTGPFQFHLAVATDRGFVHADAGLRRVVETPGAPRWPLLGRFRRNG